MNEGEVKDPLLMILSWTSTVQERENAEKYKSTQKFMIDYTSYGDIGGKLFLQQMQIPVVIMR